MADLALLLEGGDAALARPDSHQYRPQAQVHSPNRSWHWLLLATLSCVAATGTAVGAFLWLIQLPPSVDCQSPGSVSTDRAQLFCAQAAAASGQVDDVMAGLALVGQWGPSHPLFQEVQPLVDEWSQVALQAAKERVQQSDLDGAIALINQIPPTSPVYKTAQATLASWRQTWQQGEQTAATIQTALKQQDWATATAGIDLLAKMDDDYWRVNQVQALSRQVRLERQGQRLLAQSIALATPGGSDRLGAAIRTATQIDPSTYAWKSAQPYLNRWSDWLLKLGLDKWYAGDLDTAIQLGRQSALNPDRAKAAQDLIHLSQARQMALSSLGNWHSSPQQSINLYRAMLLANQISPSSAVYAQAQSSVQTWRTHLGDLGTLQIAQTIGRFPTINTLQMAIDQAQQVPQGHPRRIQAQTLIAYWRTEIERIEDRPYLAQAKQAASAGTIEAYHLAMTTASQIQLGRALRPEAQAYIYQWNAAIQTLEDQPILDQARHLAADKALSQAIAEASNIRPGRALYDDAQAAIHQWQAQIRAIELARQRARLAALDAERQAQTPPADQLEVEQPSPAISQSATDPTLMPPPGIRRNAPAPVNVPEVTPRWRSTLPDRIETVPGDSPRPDAQGTSPTTPVAPPPPLTPAPMIVPTPVEAGPAIPPLPGSVAPVAPTAAPIAPPPTLKAPPPSPDPSSTKSPDRQSSLTTPTPGPVGATVSAQPQPETRTVLISRHDTPVLYTGALYAGH